MSGLRVADLRAGYGGVPVLDGIGLEVAAGEIVALLGRNGAGKSTTLKAIAGLLPGTTGEIFVDGVHVTGPAQRRTRSALGLVLEGRSIFPSLTVVQNLLVCKVEPDAVLRIFPELGMRLNVAAGLLSGGEQQMLSVARALCRRPKAVLIDELSFGLSPLVSTRIFRVLRDVAASEGMSVLLVEQHLQYAELVADRALIMHQGTIAITMPVSELSERESEIEHAYLGGPR